MKVKQRNANVSPTTLERNVMSAVEIIGCHPMVSLSNSTNSNVLITDVLKVYSYATNIFVPGYLGIMVTRQLQFCCIFAVTTDKFDLFF